MSNNKIQKSNKETKKPPLLTPKEKKAAKHDKEHANQIKPMIPR